MRETSLLLPFRLLSPAFFSGGKNPDHPAVVDPWLWERVVWSVPLSLSISPLGRFPGRLGLSLPGVASLGGKAAVFVSLRLPPHGPLLACDWSDSRGLLLLSHSGASVVAVENGYSVVCSFLFVPTLKCRRTKRNTGLAPFSNRLILGQSSHPVLVSSLPLVGGVLGQRHVHLGLELVSKVAVL